MTRRSCGPCAAIVAIVIGLAGCGGDHTSGEVIARVGGLPITSAMFTHWMSVLAPQHMVPEPPRYAACIAAQKARAPQSGQAMLVTRCSQLYQALKQQTLDFLISSDWLVGEAADLGTPVAGREVQQRLREKEAALPNGHPEFEESLKAIAHTVPDVKLEIEAEIASAKIRQRLRQDEPAVTAAQIANYYRHHIQRFEHAEQRRFYIVENLESEMLAQERMTEFARGKASISTPGASLYEFLERPRSMRSARTIVKAIFAARPGVVSAPVKVKRYYFLVEVAHVAPANVQTLAQARDAIDRTLASEQQERALARFISAWRSKWSARTDCRPGYVVQKCRQYAGVRIQEEPLSLT